ncbi:Zn-dependent exopeptidase [Macrolepiota fuliginosa MF-IS2]|uniref:Peptide hydrolase n=1 Tax=Macrolepiota fuliginosa MF-IS2 TaxID=1400762 RepID=A0A9P5X953_9AGAR|nr:Zn-dependent exopeptidase [Macrolepiota fuliginosa MF-IS2]
MRSPSLSHAFLVLVGAAVVVAGNPLVTSKSYQATVSGDNLMKHAEKLSQYSKINDANTRAFGTIGHNKTIEYIKSSLDKTGFYDTYLDTFQYLYSDGTAALSVANVTYEIAWLTYGPGGDVNAPLVLANNLGCTQNDFPTAIAGNIALISRGNCSFSDKVALSGAAGAVGAIIYNNENGPLAGGGTLGTDFNPLGPYVPTGIVSGSDGKALISAVEVSDKLIGNLHVVATNENRTTSNVIATSKSGDQNNIVMSGGHTDSVPAGPGINDNGSGSMSILELALQLSHFRIKNAVRFGFWTAEEFGLVGSDHYVAGLSEAERNKIALYLNFDMVASPNFGYFIYDGDGNAFNITGPPGSDHIEKTFENFFASAGVKSAPTEFNGRSDYGPFLDVGIPAGGLFTGAEGNKTAEEAAWWGGQANVAYDVCYHRACDTIDNLNLPAWVQNSKAIAHSIATYAVSLDGIPRQAQRTLIPRIALPHDRRRHQACGHEVLAS